MLERKNPALFSSLQNASIKDKPHQEGFMKVKEFRRANKTPEIILSKSRYGATIPKAESINLQVENQKNNIMYSNVTIPNQIPSRISSKKCGCVMGYGANTSPGLFRYQYKIHEIYIETITKIELQ